MAQDIAGFGDKVFDESDSGLKLKYNLDTGNRCN